MTSQTMVPMKQPGAAADKAPDPSPFLIEFFMVRGLGFYCMAYRDTAGKWRQAFNHRELIGPIHIIE
ncbi:MAG TPA: hypothetical protein VF988_13015 [Verrucomicrobiae bacterium]